MVKRTPPQFRRELLDVLRKIRDEGPVLRNFGLITNISEMVKPQLVVESLVIQVMVNRCGHYSESNSIQDIWQHPEMLSVMHKLIMMLENNDSYLWVKPSRLETMTAQRDQMAAALKALIKSPNDTRVLANAHLALNNSVR